MGDLELVCDLTARLASAARIEDTVEAIARALSDIGFARVWFGALDEVTGELRTLVAIYDGVDARDEAPIQVALDPRQVLGDAFRVGQLINITDPGGLYIVERDDEPVPSSMRAFLRSAFDRIGRRPFACGPLLGRDGTAVGGVGLGALQGKRSIPDALLATGPVRALLDLVAIALERLRDEARLARLTAQLAQVERAAATEAPLSRVGSLVAGAAHDINNLCMIAQTAVNAARRSSEGAPEAALGDALGRIELATRTIGDILHRLQRVARQQPGAAVAQLEQIVEDVAALVQPMMRDRAIALDATVPPLPPVRCDVGLLHQVMLNLVINAHDALAAVPAERRAVSVTARFDGDTVVVRVSDTGPGIAPEVLARMFQPYTTTKKDGHLGVGLASSQAALAAFGGRLAAHNAPGGGAVFELFLAMADGSEVREVEAQASAGVPVLAASAAPSAPVAVAAPARILAIDDEPDIVDFIRTCLEPLGHDVETAGNAADALALAEGRAFDVVLCDVGLPRQNGIELTRVLRARGYAGKVVLMTGWESPPIAENERDAAPDLVLKKPFGHRELTHAIDFVRG